MHRNFSFPLLHCYSVMDVLQMQMQHCNKYQNNQNLSLPSGSDILPIYWSCWASAIYDLPINLRYIHKRVPSLIITQVAFVWLFSAVSFHVSPQRTWVRACKDTLDTFVWFFSTVCFQMCLQMACLRRGIVALVAFVWLFSTVRFQMCPQIACPRRGKVTLVTFVWLFSTVRF